MTSGSTTLSRLGVALALSIGSLAPPCSAAGTIVFTGRLVSGSYDPVLKPANGTAAAHTMEVHASVQAAEIVFASSGSDRKSVRLNAVGLGGMQVLIRCVATGARQPAAFSTDECRLGLGGGTLAIAIPAGPGAGFTHGAVVGVAYD